MLTVQELYSLLYGVEELCDIKPQSIHPADHPTFRVKIVPFALGAQIRNADNEEKYFHVEFYPPDHAEVWQSLAWNDSLTRRLRTAGVVQTYFQTEEESNRAKVERLLIAHFKSLSLPFRHARALTEMLISGPDNPTVLQLASLPETISHELSLYRNALCQSNPKS